jgi:biopolymer transport protein ExbB
MTLNIHRSTQSRTPAHRQSECRSGLLVGRVFGFAGWLMTGCLLSQTFAFAQDSGSPSPVEGAISATAPVASPTVQAASAVLPHNLSPWAMFLGADIVVKAVMIGLVAASFVTWTVWLVKTLELHLSKRSARRGLRTLNEVYSVTQASKATQIRDAVRKLFEAADHEMQLSSGLDAEGVKVRVANELRRIEAAAGRHMTRGLGVVATIGAIAPFVGLFGTVWGIMNSFIGISESHTTNLAVVAPGIAEALLATACGLVAAIPAVVVYNMFARSIGGYRAILSDASTTVLHLFSREIDRRRIELSHSVPMSPELPTFSKLSPPLAAE